VKVTAHGPNLLQLTRQGWVNCYLVREDDGFTLVDTMIGGSAKSIRAAAEEAGAPIVRIALTHAHADHVGSVDALRGDLPDAELAISQRDSVYLRGDKSPQQGEPPDAKARGGLPKLESQPTLLLSAGDRVGSLEVVASPGHTAGHVAYFDTRDRSLIAGDAFQSKGGVAVSGKLKPAFPFPALATWHKPTAVESARALRALDPSRMAVGHGRVIDNPAGEMDAAIAAAAG
jgi:glyoxylase-like metal-dependent hydrolase (beta-lactamase superfamily II)